MKINKEKIENFLKLLMIISVLVFTYLVTYLVATNNVEECNYVIEQDKDKKEEVRFSNRLIEKSVVNIKCDSGELGQKTYYNYNKDFNFRVVISEDWRIEEHHDYTSYYQITFSSQKQKKGYSISIYPTATNKESDIIAAIGQQFENRSETITIIDENTKKVVVTTAEVPWWISETYITKKDNFIFVIGNGATKQEDFDSFFDSFEFIN